MMTPRRNCFELNENENMIFFRICGMLLNQELEHLYTFIKKEARCKVNDLSCHFKKLKKRQINLKVIKKRNNKGR